MAAPGTITHVIEVAQQLATAVAIHRDAVAQQAAAAPVTVPATATPPPVAVAG